jgi:predicted AlkP superfamily phosphohydrolase/phosphomutase
MKRVLIAGLDGATFDIIRPLVAQGHLPNLATIMKQGAWGSLRSAMPPITPTAWTSFFTGKNPGQHGIYDFQELDRQTYQFRPVQIDRHREKSLWQLLSEAGLRCMVVDVPYTYPPRPLNGWMITGYGTPRTPDTIFTYPAGLAQQLPAHLRPEVKVALPRHRFDRSQAFIEEWQHIMDGRARLLRHWLTEREWDFFMVVFSVTDNLAHVFWTFVEPMHSNYYRPEAAVFRQAFFQAYGRCDDLLGEMMTWAGPETTTIVMSDHGFGSVRPRQYLFQRLAEGGYIRYQSPPFFSLLGDRAMKAAMRLYGGFPMLREWVKNMRPERQTAVKQSLLRQGLMPGGGGLDPARSQMIPSNYGLQIWLNEEERFAEGIVAPAARDALLQQASAYLLADQDKTTGRPIIQAVYRGEALYQGPYAGAGPDLVIDYTNFYAPETNRPRMNPHLEGGHTADGIFLAYGPAIQAGEVNGATLTDLAPTVLHLLNQSIPPDMDGRVLADIFTPGYRETHPVQLGAIPARQDDGSTSDSGYTAEQEAEIMEQLRQLGYL